MRRQGGKLGSSFAVLGVVFWDGNQGKQAFTVRATVSSPVCTVRCVRVEATVSVSGTVSVQTRRQLKRRHAGRATRHRAADKDV